MAWPTALNRSSSQNGLASVNYSLSRPQSKGPAPRGMALRSWCTEERRSWSPDFLDEAVVCSGFWNFELMGNSCRSYIMRSFVWGDTLIPVQLYCHAWFRSAVLSRIYIYFFFRLSAVIKQALFRDAAISCRVLCQCYILYSFVIMMCRVWATYGIASL